MQLSLELGTPQPVAVLHQRLQAFYGALPDCVQFDPIAQLVLALLGSRTRDGVSSAAFDRLCSAFRDWTAVCDAPDPVIFDLLRDVTFPEKKVLELREALRAVRARRGSLDLTFLESWSVDDARVWLMRLRGVGPKVSAAVLNFSVLRKRALVIDTHYLRVARRVGLLPPGVSDRRAFRVIERQLPASWSAEDVDEHHRLVKLHSQSRCRHAAPLCAGCPLGDMCETNRPAHRFADGPAGYAKLV